jgi:hypothetical protein
MRQVSNTFQTKVHTQLKRAERFAALPTGGRQNLAGDATGGRAPDSPKERLSPQRVTSWLPYLLEPLFAFGGVAEAQMAGTDAQRALKGKRIALNCVDGTTGNATYRGDGKIIGTYSLSGKPAVKDTGTVRAAGQQLCLKFNVIDDGAENCFGVSQTSARTFTFSAAGGSVPACNVAIR